MTKQRYSHEFMVKHYLMDYSIVKGEVGYQPVRQIRAANRLTSRNDYDNQAHIY